MGHGVGTCAPNLGPPAPRGPPFPFPHPMTSVGVFVVCRDVARVGCVGGAYGVDLQEVGGRPLITNLPLSVTDRQLIGN